jgi:hypothetical protein
METVLKAIADWIKGILTAGIMSNLSGLFDDVNTQVGNIAQQVGTKPSSFEPRVFAMIEALSRNVVLPIAGIILTFIACYELIEMITQHNNMAQFEPAHTEIAVLKIQRMMRAGSNCAMLLCWVIFSRPSSTTSAKDGDC